MHTSGCTILQTHRKLWEDIQDGMALHLLKKRKLIFGHKILPRPGLTFKLGSCETGAEVQVQVKKKKKQKQICVMNKISEQDYLQEHYRRKGKKINKSICRASAVPKHQG